MKAIKERNSLTGGEINDVLLGCAAPIYEQASNVGVAATLAAGFEKHVPGAQLNRFCGSGLEACNFAAAMIKASVLLNPTIAATKAEAGMESRIAQPSAMASTAFASISRS